MISKLRPLDAILPRAARSFGGKARNLAALVRAGFPVPAAYVLSCEIADAAFERVLPERLRPVALFSAAVPSDSDLAQARALVLEAPLSAELSAGLRQAFDALRAAGASSVAVRSSSLVDDHDVASAAGLHCTRLHVADDAALFDAVRACWASVFSPRVIDYLHALDVHEAGSVGVVIQAMVPADVAGRLFTANPLTSSSAEMVLHAAYGLGALVAEGRVVPDRYYIDKHTGFLRDRVIGEKHARVDIAASGGTQESRVSAERANKEALDEHSLARLIELGIRIERHLGDPQEVEWAEVGDALYVLGSRPITLTQARVVRKRERARNGKPVREASTVWSNVNVGEALPGVATPLTWSLLSSFSDLGFRKAFSALGCKIPKGSHFVGNFRGRIYLNLSELTQVASQVPGLRPSAVLSLGGGAEVERLERELSKSSSLGFVSRLPLTATRFVRENLGVRRRVERFEPAFRAESARIRNLDLRILPSPSLDDTLSDLQRLLDETGSLMLTAYGGLLAALVPLSAALRALVGEDAPRVQLDLLSALSDVESADPGRELRRIALVLQNDAAARDVIVPARGRLSLASLPQGQTHAAISAFLARHGHRGIREAELAEPRWREDPTLIFDTLRVHLRDAGLSDDLSVKRGQVVRSAGERALQDLPFATRTAVGLLLSVVRNSMRLRERLRGHVVAVLELFRMLALDVSRRIVVREPGVGHDAAFFLTLPEIHAFLRGELRALRPLLEMRRAGYERDRLLPDPPDTFVDYPPPVTQRALGKTSLDGLAASSGRVHGKARVLTSQSEISSFEPGEILVVPAADIGWSPLFLAARGLATDLGGPLSHACVVAREYGIPAVVNLRVATRTVKTGDNVLLDGDEGRLQVLADSHG